ncbi:nucleotidyltransferase [Mariniphaga sediminis]|jgi:nucleotidyltransferase substrate binding protein (TIGR01987 family)|uniref:Nucleotidyltransferase n=1 Tax=Mariniphaga sediminis TaxID=1628158 RepID=A0A399D496_9BACT|nr:nucleotidyltransferase substrate binding protein [Mariniphaga sediminis]RIH66745.1 nucleotidyltransferase [Mariniphaga sediminis]
MKKENDIRWQQRFSNFQKALEQLKKAINLSEERELSNLEKQGLIQAFEFTHELSWNVMKDFFEYQGDTTIFGSRDATREAFNKGIIRNGEGWMDMIRSRNKSSHTYNEEVAEEIVLQITETYFPLFSEFAKMMKERLDN